MTTKQSQVGFARRNALLLALVAFLAVALGFAALSTLNQRRALASQQQEIQSLDAKRRQLEIANAERIERDSLSALGFSRARVTEDTQKLTQFAKTAFTWDSGKAYEDAREKLKSQYGLTEENPFLSEFLTPSRFNEAPSGERYYYLDSEGLNASVGDDIKVDVRKVSADEYSYAVTVDVNITSDAVNQNNANSAQVTAVQRMLLFVTIDGTGTLSNLSGASADGSTRQSP